MSPYIPVDWTRQTQRDDEQSDGGSSRAVFDRDAPCPSCGYNLRGLPLGNACPECGAQPGAADGSFPELSINAPRLHRLVDLMTTSGLEERQRWRTGLTLAALCLVAVVGARLYYFAAGFTMPWPPERQYLVGGAAISVVWAWAIWMILPGRIGEVWPRLRVLRQAILITQLLWIPAYALWLLRAFNVAGATGAAGAGGGANLLIAGHLMLRAIAGIGFIGLGQLLVFICEEAELQLAAKRFNTASWLIAFPTLLGQLFVGSMPWIALALNFLVLLWWAWMLGLFVLGFIEMRHHVIWAQRHRVEAAGRAQRVAAKKKAFEQQVARQVRAVPRHDDGDQPLSE